MQVIKSSRGFQQIIVDAYLPTDGRKRLASQSSAIGDYDDSLDKPGSSYLWIGEFHHLNREQVADFICHLQHWLKTGSLESETT